MLMLSLLPLRTPALDLKMATVAYWKIRAKGQGTEFTNRYITPADLNNPSWGWQELRLECGACAPSGQVLDAMSTFPCSDISQLRKLSYLMICKLCLGMGQIKIALHYQGQRDHTGKHVHGSRVVQPDNWTLISHLISDLDDETEAKLAAAINNLPEYGIKLFGRGQNKVSMVPTFYFNNIYELLPYFAVCSA